MENSFYLPVLKSKSGEFIALSKLGPTAKKKITPLFEVTPLEWDHSEQAKPKTMEDHVMAFCKKFKTKWAHDNCFIDTSLLNYNGADNSSQIEQIFHVLNAEGFHPLPILNSRASEQFLLALERSFALNGIQEAGLRINMDDVVSEEFEMEVNTLLNRFNLTPKQVHLIMDLKDANFNEAESFAEGLTDLFESMPFFIDWKSFTIAGTSFPEQSKIKQGIWEFERNEWKLYQCVKQSLHSKVYNRSVNYGDYSIVNPAYFEFNPRTMSSSANIKYTHNRKWIVVKGRALKKSSDYLQYKVLANNIYQSPYYLGEGFSEGSKYIALCIRGEVTNGNPNTWVWVGSNHHFTKVLFDLFAILPGS